MKIGFKVTALSDKITAITDSMNYVAYLVFGKERVLLIDNGCGIGNIREVIDPIVGLRPIVAVNTHPHPDHGGANSLFAKIGVSIAGRPALPEITKDYKLRLVRAKVENLELLQLLESEMVADSDYEVEVLTEGCLIDLGGCTVECLATPGHTIGCMSFYCKEDKTLFSGDFVKPGVWMFLPESTPMDCYVHSLQKAAALDITAIYPGHHPQGFSRKLLDDLLICANRVCQCPAIGQEETLDMVGKVRSYSFGEGKIFYPC